MAEWKYREDGVKSDLYAGEQLVCLVAQCDRTLTASPVHAPGCCGENT